MDDPGACNVADQEADPDSVLAFCRRVIAARRESEDLAVGPYRTLAAPAGAWAYARGDVTSVLANLSDAPVRFDGVTGTVRVATDRGLEGSAAEDALTMPAWSGAVVVR
jgi:hypothetical protein